MSHAWLMSCMVCIDRYYRPLSSYRHAGIPVCAGMVVCRGWMQESAALKTAISTATQAGEWHKLAGLAAQLQELGSTGQHMAETAAAAEEDWPEGRE